jgi:glycosyltransferase involved in cell wall biosynthesis
MGASPKTVVIGGKPKALIPTKKPVQHVVSGVGRSPAASVAISVVIPACNAAQDLGHLLAAILPQLLPEDECIVVDDASTDSTAEVASRFPVRVVQTARRSGPAGARNLGVRNSKRQVIVFLDADVVPHPGVLDQFRTHFQTDPRLAAVMGSYDESPAASGMVSRYRNLLHCYTHSTGFRNASSFWTGCGAIRREQFERFEGFDEVRYPFPAIEDIELGVRLRRAGECIVLDPEIRVQHRKHWGFLRMLRTDLLARAAPWWDLILSSGSIPNDLNLKISQRLSVAMLVLAIAAFPALLWKPALTAAGIIVVLVGFVIGMNAGFYRFLAKHGDWRLALLGVPLHLLYFACGAIGLVIALVRRRPRMNIVPMSSPLATDRKESIPRS